MKPSSVNTKMHPGKSIALRLLEYLRPNWKSLTFASFCAIGMGSTSLSVPFFGGMAWEAVTQKSLHGLLMVCLDVIALYFLRWFLAVGQTVWFGEVSQRIGVKMRTDIYAHLQKMSLSYFDNQRTGNLLSTFSYDVPVVQTGIMSIKDAITGPIQAIGGFACILYLSWPMTAITLILLPLMGWTINWVTKKLKAISRETQDKLADVMTIAEETLSGARLVRAFCAEDREQARFRNGISAAKDVMMQGIKRQSILTPTTDFLGAIGIAAAVWIGGSAAMSGHQFMHGQPFDMKKLIEFIFFIDRIRVGVGVMGGIGSVWKQTLGAADRIFEGVLDVPAAVSDKPNAKPLKLGLGLVEFKNVGFEYIPGRPVLSAVSFIMQPGQVTAIVGPSGAGKSTISDLIPRFYDTSSGAVLVDGQDVRDVRTLSLREQMAIVPQETTIFGGTVRENITYGRPNATDQDVFDAAKAANADAFISQMPRGYDTIVGERGVMLSGGQRQRIAIARALLKDPKILILDEATSSLDEESQHLVQEALEKLMEGRTTLVIAHRLSTIKNADQIIVMQNGQLAEIGSHQELMRLGGEYARLYDTQFRTVGSSELIDSAASLLA